MNGDCLNNNPKKHIRGTVPFKSTDLTLGRATVQKEHYYDFFSYFLSSVIGKRIYNQNKLKLLISQYSTISDEAFALLVLENHEERWLHMHLHNDYKNCDIQPKYSTGGRSMNMKHVISSHSTIEDSTADSNKKSMKNLRGSKRFFGWSEAGLQRFNELFKRVLEDRKSAHAKEFEEGFLKYLQVEEGADATASKEKDAIPKKQVKVEHELWDDSNNDIDNKAGESCDASFADEEDASDNDDSDDEAPMDPRFMAAV